MVTSASTFVHRAEVAEMHATLNSLAALKEAEGDRVEIGASLYKAPVLQSMKSLIPTLGIVTGGAAILGTLGALSGAFSPGLAAGLTAALPLAVLGGHFGSEFLKDKQQESSIPSGVSVQHSSLQIDFDNLTGNSSSEAALRETAIANLRAFPGALHIVHLNGHGHGSTQIAGMAGDKANQALREAAIKGGRRFDVALYESCLNANYEQLLAAAESVDYAVAFEDLVPKSNSKVGRIPLAKMLGEASCSADAQTAAKSMAIEAGELFETEQAVPVSEVPWEKRAEKAFREELWTNPDTTAAAFDLKALQDKLEPALDELGKSLSEASRRDSGIRELANIALQDNALERTGDLVDMGGFLTQVRTGLSERESEIRQDVDLALDALKQSTLHLRTGRDLPMSGLSFHRKKVKGQREASKGWSSFVQGV